MTIRRLDLLHFAAITGAARNRRLVETAVMRAAALGTTWILTPELCVTGYAFADRLSTAWLAVQPDPWLTQMCARAAQLQVTLFLSLPERDAQMAPCYKSLFVLTPDGAVAGKHRKINVIRAGAEAWSNPGEQAVPARQVGLLICADACPLGIARSLRAQVAQVLISAAAWALGLYGPAGEWEPCSRGTGLPLIVGNRTGPEATRSSVGAASVVVQDGQRVRSFQAVRSTIMMVDWDLQTQRCRASGQRPVRLHGRRGGGPSESGG